MPFGKFLFFCLLGAFLSVRVPAQSDRLSANDKDFIELAGEMNIAAVRLGQMAQANSTTQKLKDFGLKVEHEHTADLDKLTAVANKVGGIAPNSLDDVHKNVIKRVHAAKGSSFDHAFLKAMVNQHESALVSFHREADHGFNQDLQAYAKAAIPHLEEHLKEAKQLAGSSK